MNRSILAFIDYCASLDARGMFVRAEVLIQQCAFPSTREDRVKQRRRERRLFRTDADCQRRVRYEDNALVCDRCPDADDFWPACAGTGPVSSTERGAARE